MYERNRKNAMLNKPAKLNAPVKFTSPERIKFPLQSQHLKCKQLEQRLSGMREALEKETQPINPDLSNNFKTLFSGCDRSKSHEIILGRTIKVC